MIPEDISHLADPGGEQQQETQPQPDATQTTSEPETVTFKVRGEERQIPADRLDSLAEAMGVSRDATLMWLQTGKDAGSHYQELRAQARELAQKEAELNNLYQRIEQERQQRQGFSTPAPISPMQPNGLPDDPVELLRWQANFMRQFHEDINKRFAGFDEWRQSFQQERLQEQQRRESAAIESSFQRLLDEKKKSNLPAPEWEIIERELMETGMAANRNITWEKAMERAYRNVYFDDYGRIAERRAMEKLRDPKATVTIAGGGSAAPRPPQTPTAEQQLSGLTVGEASQFLPDARR